MKLDQDALECAAIVHAGIDVVMKTAEAHEIDFPEYGWHHHMYVAEMIVHAYLSALEGTASERGHYDPDRSAPEDSAA